MTPPLALESTAITYSAAPRAASEREQLGEAARQFEAIFVRQMLASARNADFGGSELFGGEGEATFREMRDARFADITAGTGALGMADAIEAQLARFLGPEG